MRKYIDILNEATEPMMHSGAGDPYATFSSSALLKQIIDQGGAEVSMGPRPGTLYVDFGDLRLTVQIIDSNKVVQVAEEAMTIAGAQDSDGEISRKKSERILDPEGFFKNAKAPYLKK